MPESRFTHANGINLHYLDWRGSGATIVCLHGVTGHAHAWDAVAEALSPQYRVLAIDQRGHGDSEKPASDYATADFAADLEGFARNLALDSFILMGHSMGTRIACYYAGQYPARTSHLVLEDPFFPYGSGACPPTHGVIERVNARPAAFASLEQAADLMGDETDLMAAQPRKERVSREALLAQAAASLRQRADGQWEYKYSHRAILDIMRLIQQGDDDIMSRLAKITAPALLLRGGDSGVCTEEMAGVICAAIRDCRTVTIPGVAHAVHGDKLPQFLAAVREFLG